LGLAHGKRQTAEQGENQLVHCRGEEGDAGQLTQQRLEDSILRAAGEAV
jgi:hypothetical protein